ncbi:MAG TPA: DUF2797 domain-containing protein [Gammaproteobacteria bacterium]|nr:DUF2797 domain-containing protein [Gammaproteobacteria bacterium]
MNSGHLRKMVTSLESPVQYSLPLDDELIQINECIGEKISLHYTGEIHCIGCGRKTAKSYNQGYCYPCFQKLACCDMCIMKPETCHYDKGTCREPDWALQNCMQGHIVYLANSSGVKVGITRETQIPARWIDQGASQALPVFRVSSRLLSGKLEMVIKQQVSDRTDWRKMLRGKPEIVDLVTVRDEITQVAYSEIDYIINSHEKSDVSLLTAEIPVEINFPVKNYPEKVKSLNFDKTTEIEGLLMGIKGQYLILDTGVLNIRKFAGYRIRFSCENKY